MQMDIPSSFIIYPAPILSVHAIYGFDMIGREGAKRGAKQILTYAVSFWSYWTETE
jgi:hypothetical protein